MLIGSLTLITSLVLSLKDETFFDTWKYQRNSAGVIKESKRGTSPTQRSGHILGILMQKRYNLHPHELDMSF